MKIVKVLLYIVFGSAALFFGFGLFARKNYRVERSLEINAPRELVYEYVRYYKNFADWSPWQQLDPDMKATINGPDGEAGATYAWQGNSKAGSGKQTIKSASPDRIEQEIAFSEPFESTSPVTMTFEPQGRKTKVTWVMDMHVAFPWNGLAMLTDVDAGVGRDYAVGLGNLKKICEKAAFEKYRGYDAQLVDLPQRYYLGVRETIGIDTVDRFYARHLPTIYEAVQAGKGTMAGMPSGLVWTWDTIARKADMAAALPLTESKMFGKGYQLFPAGGQALVIEHLGPLEKTADAHHAMTTFLAEKQLQPTPFAVEEYMTDPATEPDTTKWLTKVIYFVKKEEQKVNNQ